MLNLRKCGTLLHDYISAWDELTCHENRADLSHDQFKHRAACESSHFNQTGGEEK